MEDTTMRTDAREQGRIILAHGEITGHAHEVVTEAGVPPGMDAAQYYVEPDGRRVLLVVGDDPVYLRHEEHGAITVDPIAAERGAARLASGVALVPGETIPGQYRQGDVLLHPIGRGAWQVIRQREIEAEGWRVVAD